MNEVKIIQNRQTVNQRQAMKVGDVYYVLFRQKWKILFFIALGVGLGIYLYQSKPPLYASEAKLFIRYVVDTKKPGSNGEASNTRSTDEQGANIINSEVEIMTSYDLAQQVAELVGPERILAKSGGGKEVNQAADLVAGNLVVDSPNKDSVIRVTFRSIDPDIVQPVLHQLIESYMKKHVEIHQAPGEYDDFLQQQTDQLRQQLTQTEAELRKARQGAQVISLDDTRKSYTAQISKIQQEIFDTEAELAERTAVLTEIQRHIPAATNTTPTAAAAADMPDSQTVSEYKNVIGRLETLWKRQDELLTQYTDENSQVKTVKAQIVEAEKLQKKLEALNPKLVTLNITPTSSGERSSVSSLDLNLEAAKIVALQTKVKVLNSQVGQIRSAATNMDAQESGLVELERKRDLQLANYKYLSQNLQQERFDEALGAGKNSNISVIQTPSPPFRDGMKAFKTPVAAMVGCIVAGLVLAFLMELQLDTSVKRPSEIESKLRLPLFLAIPRVKMSSPARMKEIAAAEQAQAAEEAEASAAANGTAGPPALAKSAPTGTSLWSRDPALNPYYEALRDRIILDFELRELTHTPKLIAVTGCGHGSGVTTVALGLAASLSETGAGNVLLVDMNREPAAAQQFYKGRTVCELDEALKAKDSALTHNNLYVVTEGAGHENVPRMMPKRFANLVPKLRASDYDYIIFDMPPVSPTSVTPRVAGFMDQVLLVMESEKTSREVVLKATALLAESKASVSAVLNKTRAYVPPLLEKEF